MKGVPQLFKKDLQVIIKNKLKSKGQNEQKLRFTFLRAPKTLHPTIPIMQLDRVLRQSPPKSLKSKNCKNNNN